MLSIFAFEANLRYMKYFYVTYSNCFSQNKEYKCYANNTRKQVHPQLGDEFVEFEKCPLFSISWTS